MASMSTPTRLNRGLIVPGIDTKYTDRPSSALSYFGLHTPPQSANEHRRPSIQFSGYDESKPYSAASSTFSYSTPVTPVHALRQGNEGLLHSWPDHVASQPGMVNSLGDPCQSLVAAESTLDAAFEPQVACSNNMASLHGLPSFGFTSSEASNNLGLNVSSDLPHVPSWASSNHLPNEFAAHTPSLGPSPFSLASHLHSSVTDIDSRYQVAPSSIDTSFDGSVITGMQGISTGLFQTPQVIVPSQLSPVDVYQQTSIVDFAPQDSRIDDSMTSFGSDDTTLAVYDSVNSPSPMEAYFDQSDEEYSTVKNEDMSDIEDGERFRRISTRNRRRSSKRIRDADKRPWHVHDIPNGDPYAAIEVHCVGKRFPLDRPVKREIANSKKAHQCLFVTEDGRTCGARFDRSEHLKRHAGKHNNIKLYPCPIKNCRKNQRPIGRPVSMLMSKPSTRPWMLTKPFADRFLGQCRRSFQKSFKTNTQGSTKWSLRVVCPVPGDLGELF